MLKKTAVAFAAAIVLLAGCDGSSNKITALDGITFYVSDGASIYTVKDGDTFNVSEKTLTGLNGGTLLYAMDFNPRAAGTMSPPMTGTTVESIGLNGLGSDGQT